MVIFEATRNENLIATRDMIVHGQCFDGFFVNQADDYLTLFNSDVDQWIRTEYLAEDLAKALDLSVSAVAEALMRHKANVTAPYIKEMSFWFTDDDLTTLYASNPLWASVEERLYGRAPTILRSRG